MQVYARRITDERTANVTSKWNGEQQVKVNIGQFCNIRMLRLCSHRDFSDDGNALIDAWSVKVQQFFISMVKRFQKDYTIDYTIEINLNDAGLKNRGEFLFLFRS